MNTVILSIAAIVVLLALAGFFAGSETALTAVSRGKMYRLEREGSRSARNVNFLVADRERLIGALLLGNTFVNILASSLATSVLTVEFGSRAVPIATAIMTVVILIFGEVLPKTLAIARTDRFALNVAAAVRIVVATIGPLVYAVRWVVWRLLNLFGISERGAAPVIEPHEEIRGTVALHHLEGSMQREHRDMIGGVLDLPELKAGDIMTHRKNMVSLDAALAPRALFEAAMSAEHSRIPLWRDQPENIVGILHARDVVREAAHHRDEIDSFDFASLATPAWFVPETTALEDQLRAFRHRKSHFAVVVDEYGALQGIVTLEDIVDEIFGDIPDEDEAGDTPGIRPQPDGTFIIDGDTPVREANRALEWSLPDDEATTLAGLVIHEARAIPETGQRFAFYGFQFEIVRRQRNQITAIRVTPPAKEAGV